MKFKVLFIFIMLFSPMGLKAQEIALQLYSLRNQIPSDPAKYLQMIADWGIHALEGGGGYGMSDSEYQKLLADNDLRVVGVGADYNKLKTDPQAILAEAKKYGAKFATCY